MGDQLGLAAGLAPVEVRHGPPGVEAIDTSLVGGQPDVGDVPAVHGSYPLREVSCRCQDLRTCRVRTADVDGCLALVGTEIDRCPVETGLVVDPVEQPQVLGVALEAGPAPTTWLAAGADAPQLIERPLDAGELGSSPALCGQDGVHDVDDQPASEVAGGGIDVIEPLLGELPAHLVGPGGEVGELGGKRGIKQVYRHKTQSLLLLCKRAFIHSSRAGTYLLTRERRFTAKN